MNENNEKNVENLFENWDEALIWSCLQGHMGRMIVNDTYHTESAIVDIGDFCFCAGKPDANLLLSLAGFKIVVPKDEDWGKMIEDLFGQRAAPILRYAIKKDPTVFCKEKLLSYVADLDDRYTLRMFDEEIFEMAKGEHWSIDLCSQFRDYPDYQNRAVGTAILHEGKLVAGASPYAVYDNGIEIEIDTKPEYRGKGLATVCGAKLILECMSRNIYPSWDAHDLRSVHLAEKLGYELSHPYEAFETQL